MRDILLTYFISILLTSFLGYILFRPGIFQMIGYTLWQLFGKPFEENVFIYIYDIVAVIIFFLITLKIVNRFILKSPRD